MKKFFDFHVDCGRMGDISATFVATQEEVDNLCNKTVYFGEILGKHSEVELDMKPEYFTVKTDNQEFLEMAEKLGINLDFGHVPFDYIDEE